MTVSPPVTVAGATASAASTGADVVAGDAGVTVTIDVCVAPPKPAPTVTVVAASTGPASTLKLADDCAAGTT